MPINSTVLAIWRINKVNNAVLSTLYLKRGSSERLATWIVGGNVRSTENEYEDREEQLEGASRGNT